ncbi:MAG: GDSL-type esterase/lipase family protein [Bacteroidales bacterium]|jgi:lysophospholipase L1-like esterase|nr:GDSL-type esterase/lipase family protein [Bacteroidales bacterium]
MSYKRYYFFVGVLLLCKINLHAQSVFQGTSLFSSDYMTETYIDFPAGDNTIYDDFFKKLDQLIFEGEGNLTILHIGGSHIQAGTLSHQIRINLLSTFPGLVGNRGLIFPFSAAKTNNPQNYKTTYTGDWEICTNTHRLLKFPLGLMGICIATSDIQASIGIKLRNTDDVTFDFNRVYVLGTCDSGHVRVMLQIRDSIIVEGVYDTVKSAYCFELGTYTDAFTLFFEKEDTLWDTFYLRGFWLENNLPGISYVDVGVNGARVSSYLKCDYLENDLAFVNPDMCIFSIGINDASGSDFDTTHFQNNYKELIRRIRTVSPHCAILFTTNNDSFHRTGKRYYNNSNGRLAQQSFYSLAKYYNAGVWDLFSFMGGLNSMKKWETKGLAQRDKIHFTPQGYTVIGNFVYNAFIFEYINHLKNTSIIHGLE